MPSQPTITSPVCEPPSGPGKSVPPLVPSNQSPSHKQALAPLSTNTANPQQPFIMPSPQPSIITIPALSSNSPSPIIPAQESVEIMDKLCVAVRASPHPILASIDTTHINEHTLASRRPSIQFMPSPSTGSSTRRHNSIKSGSRQKRHVSPPPPPLFEKRVSFNTFEKETLRTSISLVNTHRDFVHSKTSRRFLCGLDSNDYSEFALQWLFDEMVDDNDEVVCLRVVDKDSTSATAQQKYYREEAQTLMGTVLQKNVDGKAIQVTLEFAIGRVQEVFGQMIQLHEPMMVVVGTKGRSRAGIQSLLPGSISKYALQCSPVPVIVVNPGLVREKRKKKRMLDRSRRGYRDLLDKASEHPLTLQPFSNDIARSGSSTQLSGISTAMASALSGPNSLARRAGGLLSRPGSGIFTYGQGGGHTRNSSTLSRRSSILSAVGLGGQNSGPVPASNTTSSGGNEDTGSSPLSSAGSSPVSMSLPTVPASLSPTIDSRPKLPNKGKG